MAYSIFISDEAALDIIEAFNWYQAIDMKLSIKFEKEIERSLEQIKNNPNQFQLKYKAVRVLFLNKFPFGIHYIKNNKKIRIVALFHTSRNPNNWVGEDR